MSPEKVKAFKERARREWTDAEVGAAWGRWHAPFAAQTRAATELIIAAAGVEPKHAGARRGRRQWRARPGNDIRPHRERHGDRHGPGTVDVAAAKTRQPGLTNLSLPHADAEELPCGRLRGHRGAGVGSPLSDFTAAVAHPLGRLLADAANDPADSTDRTVEG